MVSGKRPGRKGNGTVPMKWAGHRVTKARATVATWLPMPCGKCGKEVSISDQWIIGHKKSRAVYPELMWEPSNWQPEHRACSDRTGQAGVIEKARNDLMTELKAQGVVFPLDQSPSESPPLPFSLPNPSEPLEIRDGLTWDNLCQNAPDWLAPYLQIPPDASPPLAVSGVHPDAVGSLGDDAIEYIEETQKITLRWWQRLAFMLQLQYDADDNLLIRFVVESAPRRAGKSIRLRGLALWRMACGDFFGEPQTIIHTGSDVAICREIQRQAWRWAEEEAGYTVSRANGKEALETPEGDRWLVRAQSAVYGYDVCLGMIDEGWDVQPGTVDDGLEPATLERVSPQLVLTSTAHRRATSLMRKRIGDMLASEDHSTLLLWWGARPDDDPADPETWRKASPHWTSDRQKLIEKKYLAAINGESDPEADDPDPMEGFIAQYLNVWRLKGKARSKGEPITDQNSWDALIAETPPHKPDAVAVESWFDQGTSVAFAWRIGDRVHVKVQNYVNLQKASEAISATGFRGFVIVGSSLMSDPALRGMRLKAGTGRTLGAVQEITRLLGENRITHDGSAHLKSQVLNVRTVPGADGPRMASQGRSDGLKAAVWAVTAASATKPAGRRILLPTV